MGGISGAGIGAREIDARLRELDPAIRAWAVRACRAHADGQLTHLDDVANLMRWECARLLERSEPDVGAAPTHALLHRVTQRSADRYFHSSARTGFTGATGAARRASRARAVEAGLLSALGRQPTRQEITIAANAAATRARSNPAKQGALIQRTDDLLHLPVPLDAPTATDTHVTDPLEAVDARMDSALAVRRTIELCRAVREELGDLAELWLGGAPDGVMPTVAELAELSSRRADEVRRLLDECRLVAELVWLEGGLRLP